MIRGIQLIGPMLLKMLPLKLKYRRVRVKEFHKFFYIKVFQTPYISQYMLYMSGLVLTCSDEQNVQW